MGSVIDFLSGVASGALRFYRKLVALWALTSKSTRPWLPQPDLGEAEAVGWVCLATGCTKLAHAVHGTYAMPTVDVPRSMGC
jgi:hypothetical protein